VQPSVIGPKLLHRFSPCQHSDSLDEQMCFQSISFLGLELPHHRNRYTPQPPTTARGTYPQNFNSPQAPLFSTTDGIFRFRGGYTR